MLVAAQCQRCLHEFSLPESIGADYDGPWRCPQCTAQHRIKAFGGELATLALVDELGLPVGDFPAVMAASLREVVQCYNAGALRGSAVMLRRVLEVACADKGAKGKTLAQQIVDLGERMQALDEVQRAMANAIRLFGNYGAHPSDDGLDEVSQKDVRRAIELGFELLGRLYSTPKS